MALNNKKNDFGEWKGLILNATFLTRDVKSYLKDESAIENHLTSLNTVVIAEDANKENLHSVNIGSNYISVY